MCRRAPSRASASAPRPLAAVARDRCAWLAWRSCARCLPACRPPRSGTVPQAPRSESAGSRSHVAVVGAGIAGLAAAVELAARAEVTVLAGLPMSGGVLPYDLPAVRELTARCRSAGVQWLLGTTAVRWDSGRLLTVGPSGIRWLDAAHLVFAGGARPATAAELMLAGPRLAGVLPAPVAIHLAEAKVTIGRQVVIIGTGDWARAARDAIAHQRSPGTLIAAEGGQQVSFPHDALIGGWSPVAVAGNGRGSTLTLQRAGERHVLDCGAVILAASPRPLRIAPGAT